VFNACRTSWPDTMEECVTPPGMKHLRGILQHLLAMTPQTHYHVISFLCLLSAVISKESCPGGSIEGHPSWILFCAGSPEEPFPSPNLFIILTHSCKIFSWGVATWFGKTTNPLDHSNMASETLSWTETTKTSVSDWFPGFM